MLVDQRTTVTELRYSSDQLVVIDLLPANRIEQSKLTVCDLINRPVPGTTFELVSMDSTFTGDPAGCHFVVLKEELPAWQAAAEAHGLQLQVTDEPVRLGIWDGDATVEDDGAGNLVIRFPY